MLYRKAEEKDIPAIAQIYSDIHTQEESGAVTIGWNRAIYPTEQTAHAALQRGDLFVQETDGRVTGAAIINRIQVESYFDAHWQYQAPEDKVMVLHTMAVHPKMQGRGIATEFVRFYERYAAEQGCTCLRLDTNATNKPGRTLYPKLGYREAGVVPCTFNGIEGVDLLCYEKSL